MVLLTYLGSGALPAQAPSSPQPEQDREAAIQRLAQELAPRLAQARYMEANPQPITVPGWEGYPTTNYTYSVRDRSTGTNKTASVIMLNPDARQLARWIVTACLEAKGSADEASIHKLANHIISQSGAQFPVRGVVYEDILPANGINEVYCFMDGVTVKINGVDHRSEKQPSPEEMQKALKALAADVTWVGKYARVQSATREDYQKAGGKEDVEGTAWLNVSRKLYQAAWKSDRNELMIAWAKAHL
jgi:endoglucanase